MSPESLSGQTQRTSINYIQFKTRMSSKESSNPTMPALQSYNILSTPIPGSMYDPSQPRTPATTSDQASLPSRSANSSSQESHRESSPPAKSSQEKPTAKKPSRNEVSSRAPQPTVKTPQAYNILAMPTPGSIYDPSQPSDPAIQH